MCFLREAHRCAPEPVSFLPGDGSAGAPVPLWGDERANADAPWVAVHVVCRGDLLLCCGVCKADGASPSRKAGHHQLLSASAFPRRPGADPLWPLSAPQVLTGLPGLRTLIYGTPLSPWS